MGFFDKIKETFSKNKSKDVYLSGFRQTSKSINSKLDYLKNGYSEANDAFLESLMISLIQCDIGVETSKKIVDGLKKKLKTRKIEFEEVIDKLYESMSDVYGANDYKLHLDNEISVIFMVGVNGSGKTTTTAKLAKQYTEMGKKVLLVAADTFRAGAVDQLQKWAEKLNVECICGKENADPASVIVDGLRYAKDNKFDLVLCDTAGRLQNKSNLMNELAKMKKVAEREINGAPQEVLLVIDATTGQNGLSQAKIFTECTSVSGIVLTKMDGTAKGGIVLAIKDQLKLPVVYVGCGEKIDDLKEFDLDLFFASIAEGVNYNA